VLFRVYGAGSVHELPKNLDRKQGGAFVNDFVVFDPRINDFRTLRMYVGDRSGRPYLINKTTSRPTFWVTKSKSDRGVGHVSCFERISYSSSAAPHAGRPNRSYAQIYIGQFDASARGDALLAVNDSGVSFSGSIAVVNSETKQAAAYASWAGFLSP
jgi:hypothetical protein